MINRVAENLFDQFTDRTMIDSLNEKLHVVTDQWLKYSIQLTFWLTDQIIYSYLT